MYHHYYYNWETIPKTSIPLNSEDPTVDILVSNGDYVRAGDSIVRFHFAEKWYKNDLGDYYLVSEYDGFVCGTWGKANDPVRGVSPIHNVLLLSICSEPVDDLQCRFPSVYSIAQDTFTSERIISWERVAGFSGRFYRLSSWHSFVLEFVIKDQSPYLNIYYPRKDIRLRKKDSVSFHFEDGTIMSLPVIGSPILEDKLFSIYYVSFQLTQKEVLTFSTIGWDVLRLEFSNGERPLDVSNQFSNNQGDYDVPITSSVFCRYAQEFSNAIKELGIFASSIEEKPHIPKVTQFAEEPCYVYLMVDTTNGYHKIGISNHPEYRERTLQSEKPTIEKVCDKKFPSRLIAQSIESALHSAFASKRIRGEWFNLSEQDIAQIIETLK